MPNDEIRLEDILISMLKHRMLVLALTLAGLVIGMVVTFVNYMMGEVSKEYTIVASIAVTSENQNGLFTARTDTPNSADIHLSEDMVDSTMYLLKSDRIMNEVIRRMNLVGIPTNNLSSHLTLSRYRETQIIEMTFYWRSAEEGVRILDALIDIAPDILVETLKIGSVSVLNEPVAKYRVGGTLSISTWLLFAVGGFFLGAGFCAVQTLMFPTLVNVADVHDRLRRELLGQVPSNPKFYRQHPLLQAGDTSRVGANVRESYAAAAYALHNRLRGGGKILYVTSTERDEGKTSTVANLAVQLAKQEHRVLMIDFDVHSPSLGSLFLQNVQYEQTINAVFRGDISPKQAVVPINVYLDLVPGILEKRELPMDDSTLTILRELCSGYDYVLIDTAPVGCSVDILMLNRIACGALYVMQYDSCTIARLQEGLKLMDNSGITTIGCIVNNVRQYSVPFLTRNRKEPEETEKTPEESKESETPEEEPTQV